MIRRSFILGMLSTPAIVRASSLYYVPREKIWKAGIIYPISAHPRALWPGVIKFWGIDYNPPFPKHK